MRHPVAQQLAAALQDDAQPSARIVLEMIAFEGIKLVTNKDGDRHWPSLRMICLRRGVFCRRCRNATRFLSQRRSGSSICTVLGRAGALRTATQAGGKFFILMPFGDP